MTKLKPINRWVSQGTWIFLQGMCLWSLNEATPANHEGALTLLDGVGVATFFTGLVTEHVSDMQKTAYNARIKSGVKFLRLCSRPPPNQPPHTYL